jgi:hypothetical protein
MTLTLREKQSLFLFNFAKLILWINSQSGMTATAGELLRTEEMQKLYLQSGKTKAARSMHQDKLAGDLNIFINGVYQSNKEAYKGAAEYWKSLHPDNVAGYDWGWDANHFEMKP